MNKKYLVTGGLGFIGSALVRALLERGEFVRTLDNSWRSKVGDVDSHLEFDQVIGDVRNPEVVQEAARGMDVVCHLAAINGTQNFYDHPDLVLDVGVRGMLNVLDACKKEKVSDLLVMSTSEVYQTPPIIPTPETAPLSIPDPLNPRYSYAASKIISEMLALHCEDGLQNFRIVRPHNVYGPAMGEEHVIPQFILRMLQLKRDQGAEFAFPIQGSGQETRAFVYISDMIAGTLQVIDKGENRGIYHVGTEIEVSVETIAQMLAKNLGCQIHIQPGKLAEGGTLRRCPDIRLAQQLGYQPKTNLEEGLALTCRWYAEHAADKTVVHPRRKDGTCETNLS